MKKLIFLLIITLSILVSGSSFADKRYILNGAQPFSNPILTPYQHVRIGGSFGVQGAYSCGNFDFTSSIANQLSQAKDRLRTSIVSSVQGLLAALPELLLQRIRPDFYDLYQKLMVRAEADIRVAYQSCEAWKNAFSNTDKGTSEIMKEAISVDWNAQVTTNENDIWSAQKQVEENSAEKGIRWCDGNYRGGRDTEALEPLRDAAIAGYNTLMGRSCTNNTSLSNAILKSNKSTNENPITEHFPSPEDVKDFAVEVVGDYVFKASETNLREGSIPQGLNGLINLKQEEIKQKFIKGSENSFFLDGNELRKYVSYPGGPKITSEVLEALDEMETGVRNLTINNLSYELAGAHVIDKALNMKKILNASKYIPELKSSNFIQTTIDSALETIDQQIRDIMFEKELRETFYAETATNIVNDYHLKRRLNSNIIPKAKVKGSVKDGGIVNDGDN